MYLCLFFSGFYTWCLNFVNFIFNSYFVKPYWCFYYTLIFFIYIYFYFFIVLFCFKSNCIIIYLFIGRVGWLKKIYLPVTILSSISFWFEYKIYYIGIHMVRASLEMYWISLWTYWAWSPLDIWLKHYPCPLQFTFCTYNIRCV